jgi:hypothetical protein
MPLATINKNDPVVIPASAEEQYAQLELEVVQIKKNGRKYSVRAVFVPYDNVNDAELTSQPVKWACKDFVEFTVDDLTLRNAAKTFVKELARAAQETPDPNPGP